MVVDAEHLVEALGEVGEVVRGEQDDAALVAEGLEHLDDALLRADVDAAEGLVEQDDDGFLRQGAGDEDALPLAAGQLRDQGGAVVPHIHALQAEADRLLVALAGAPQPADVVLAAHHDHVVHGGGEDPVDAVALGT